MIVVQEVVFAEKAGTGVTLHGEVVKLFAGRLLAVTSHVW